MMRFSKRPGSSTGMICIILAGFSCLLFLFQYYNRETIKLQAVKSQTLTLLDSWNRLENATKDLVIAEDLTGARTRWDQALTSFDRQIAGFLGSGMIRRLRGADSAFDENVRETDNMWRVMKPRIEYVRPRLNEYIASQNGENKRSLLYELLFQVEQGASRHEYMTLFDLTFDINYMVSSLSTYFVSVLNKSAALISESIDTKARQVQYLVWLLAIAIVAVTIAFIAITQRNLNRSQERFRQVVELSPFPICIVDETARAEYVNSKFVAVLGYSLSDLADTGAWVQRAFPLPEDRDGITRFWESGGKRAGGGEGEPVTLCMQCKDGSQRNVVFRQVEMVDKKRFVICEDITERLAAEKALCESERKFRAIFDQTFQFTGLLDPQGTLLELNRTALDYGRVREEDVIGKPFWETPWWSHSEEARKTLRDAIAQAAEGEFARFETTNRGYDGSISYLDGSIKPVRNEEGRVIMLIPEGRDITERKKAEQERAQLISAIEQTAETIVVFDDKGVILYANPAVGRLMGCDPSELIGNNSLAYSFDGDTQHSFEELSGVFRRGESWAGRATQKRRDGTLMELEITISPVKDSAGSITGFVTIGRDITRELRMEEQLRQAQKMEAIGTLAGGIAHDFNNILAAIMGYTELALDQLTPGHPVVYNLNQILKSGTRARDLVRQILAFSRKQQKERRTINVCTLAGEAAKLLRASIPSTIEIRQDFSGELCLVHADATQLHQVIMNLCTNAAQAMEEHGGVLTLGVHPVDISADDSEKNPDLLPGGQYIRLAVSDTGAGIPQEIISRIFDPFFTTKEVGKGTGMGLAVVHGIVRDHGGAIHVQNEAGPGARFDVLFPRRTGDQEEAGEMQGDIPRGSGTILFVDDESMLVDVQQRMLAELGYRVVCKRDSLEALAAFKAAPSSYDVVITDQTMPHMTGCELAQKLLAVRPDIPVILCTGFSERVSEETVREIGIRAFVMKPYNMRQLGHTLRKVLGQETQN